MAILFIPITSKLLKTIEGMIAEGVELDKADVVQKAVTFFEEE